MLEKFKQNLMVQTTRNFELKLLFNAKLSFEDYHLLVFQKLRHSDTCNQVKSCTKPGGGAFECQGGIRLVQKFT